MAPASSVIKFYVGIEVMAEGASTGSVLKPLFGTDEATIDDKGRLQITKTKRERLGDDFVVCRGSTGCLEFLPAAEWENRVAMVNQTDSMSEAGRHYRRMLFGTAVDDLKFDSAGRVIIPKTLRELAGIRSKVKIVGMGAYFEVWDDFEYESYQRKPDEYQRDRIEFYGSALKEMRESANSVS